MCRSREPRLLNPTVNGSGYQVVSLYPGGATTRVQGLVLLAFVGPRPPERPHTRHLDGNSTNNALSNLAYGTQAENEADKRRHGTSAQGERHWHAQLREAQVRAIREMARAGAATSALAKEFGVSSRAIRGVVTRETWPHVA